MAFDPIDYYQLAGWLYKQQSMYVEAQARAVVSKSYYGAFLAARGKAGITDKSLRVHEKVHDHFIKTGKLGLANRLDESRVQRNIADYDTEQTITSLNSSNALKRAKRIFDELGVAIPPVA